MSFDLNDPAQRRDYLATLMLQTFVSSLFARDGGLPRGFNVRNVAHLAYEAADALEAARNEVKK